MPLSARLCIAGGSLALVLVLINQISAPQIDPALQRSSALAALVAVALLLVGVLWTRMAPLPPERADLVGSQGLVLRQDLPEGLRRELEWGSKQVLTATPAAVVLLLWQQQCLLLRGLLPETTVRASAPGFTPGTICSQVLERQRSIHLVDLRLYPGRDEFMTLLDGLPSVVVQPAGREGLLLVGGWSPRCFGRGDLAWIEGWAEKLRDEWLEPPHGEPLRLQAT